MSGCTNNAHRFESETSGSTLGKVISYPENFPDLPQSLKPDTWSVSHLGKGWTKFAKKNLRAIQNSRR